MANFNTNYTYSPGVAPAVIEYYERALLENMQPEMVHNMDAQKRTLPLNNGKTVQFRRFSPFPAITTPLAEGVTPDGQTLEETAFRAMVKGYGGYVTMTDEMQWYMLDNMHQETVKLLADQAALSLDTIARNALCTGLNVQCAGGRTNRAAITAADILTYDEIKKAVRTLKRNNVKPCGDGFYHAIVHPDVVHDLTASTMWVDVAKYQDKTAVQRYELGTIYKVKFFESTNAMVYPTTAETNLLDAANDWAAIATLSVTGLDAATRKAKYTANVTADQARALTGKMVTGTFASTDYPMCIEHIDYANKVITFRWVQDGVSGSGTIKPAGVGTVPVYATLIYGANAYGSVELGGTGRNVQIIVKEPGSSGSLDPLNQRGTIAWRVNGFCTAILQDDFIVRVESAATA
jgi:N4-gp56 family major capsid protein